MGTVLDYSEYNTVFAREYIEDGHGAPDKSHRCSGANTAAFEWNATHYTGLVGRCPYCDLSLALIRDSPTRFEMNQIWQCSRCGWWEIERIFQGVGNEHEVAYAAVHHQACLRHFDAASSSIPAAVLTEHLREDPDAMLSADKTKLEQVIQYIFSSYFNCEVKHCGQSHDGGIDLVLIDSDEPIMIQVKGRESPDAVESIGAVREFLGALWVKKSVRGVFVTTADHYSPVCHRAINTMLRDGRLKSFDLIDFDRICAMLRNVKSNKHKQWEELMARSFYLAK